MKVVSSEASHGELGLTAVTCDYQKILEFVLSK